MSSHANLELDRIRAIVRDVDNVGGLEDVASVLASRSVRGERAEFVDLIAHSRPPGFLVLGDWLIDDSTQTAASFVELLRPWLTALGVRRICLLGCRSATTERGRNALRRIARASSCKVLGTIRYIGDRDYDARGFVSEEALVDADGVGSAESQFIRPHSESRDRSI